MYCSLKDVHIEVFNMHCRATAQHIEWKVSYYIVSYCPRCAFFIILEKWASPIANLQLTFFKATFSFINFYLSLSLFCLPHRHQPLFRQIIIGSCIPGYMSTTNRCVNRLRSVGFQLIEPIGFSVSVLTDWIFCFRFNRLGFLFRV